MERAKRLTHPPIVMIGFGHQPAATEEVADGVDQDCDTVDSTKTSTVMVFEPLTPASS